MGRGQEDPRRRAVDQAAAADDACSSRAASRRSRRTSSAAIALRARDRLLLASSARPTASASRRSRSSRSEAKEAGLRLAYLQFDGVGNEANAHRKVGNLFDVKLRAIENLHARGDRRRRSSSRSCNGVNNDQVGRDPRFAIENADKITVVSLPAGVASPAATRTSTTRRRKKQRYTLSHLAHDVKDADRRRPSRCATGSRSRRSGPFSRPDRPARRPEADWGSLKCGCHPNCGIGTVLLVEQEDEADGAARRVPRPRAAPRGHPGDHRRRAARKTWTAVAGRRCRSLRNLRPERRPGGPRRSWSLVEDHGRPHGRRGIGDRASRTR